VTPPYKMHGAGILSPVAGAAPPIGWMSLHRALGRYKVNF